MTHNLILIEPENERISTVKMDIITENVRAAIGLGDKGQINSGYFNFDGKMIAILLDDYSESNYFFYIKGMISPIRGNSLLSVRLNDDFSPQKISIEELKKQTIFLDKREVISGISLGKWK